MPLGTEPCELSWLIPDNTPPAPPQIQCDPFEVRWTRKRDAAVYYFYWSSLCVCWWLQSLQFWLEPGIVLEASPEHVVVFKHGGHWIKERRTVQKDIKCDCWCLWFQQSLNKTSVVGAVVWSQLTTYSVHSTFSRNGHIWFLWGERPAIDY